MTSTSQLTESEPVRLGVLLSAVQACVFFNFILMSAISPQTLQIRVYGSIPLSFILGLGVIVSGIVLTAIYVMWANSASPRTQKRGGQ